MKVKYKKEINGHLVISHITDATVDSQATMAKILPLITPVMTDKEKEHLYNENLVYSLLGNEAEYIDDELAEQLQLKLDSRGEHQLVLNDGEYIADYRNVEYWIKTAGKWTKEKIEEVGVELPSAAFIQENLSSDQQKEIYDQQEEERVASLTPEQKAEEQKAKIQARFAEIDRLDGPRPIREAVAQLANSAGLDTSYLMRHEEEAQELREQYALLSA